MSQQQVITASEIGEYLYCHRAWWYKLQGYASENVGALAEGRAHHESVAQTVTSYQRQTRIAVLLIVLALFLALVTAVSVWLLHML